MAMALPYPEAVAAFVKSTHPGILRFVNNDALDYWRLWKRLWTEGEPFILVEHDIVVTPKVIDDLASCGSPWCAFPYHEEVGEPVTGLGCTKFVPDPGVSLDLGGMPDPIWQNVDTTVAGILQAAGWTVHEHGPWLRHLNPKVATMQTSEATR